MEHFVHTGGKEQEPKLMKITSVIPKAFIYMWNQLYISHFVPKSKCRLRWLNIIVYTLSQLCTNPKNVEILLQIVNSFEKNWLVTTRRLDQYALKRLVYSKENFYIVSPQPVFTYPFHHAKLQSYKSYQRNNDNISLVTNFAHKLLLLII